MKRFPQLLVALLASALAVVSLAAPAEAQDTTQDVEVVIAIDTSGSMSDVMELAKAAANQFVVSMPAGVRIGVETFGDEVTVLTPPTTDRALLSLLIAGIVADGDTALYDAVITASQQFSPEAEHKVIVVLSDGRDEGSAATLDAAILAVQGVQVEAISLTTSNSDIASLTALGRVTSADDSAGVSAAFGRVADLLVAEVVEPTTTVAPTTIAPAITAAAATPTPASTTVYSRPAAPPAAMAPAAASESSLPLLLGAGGVFAGLFALGLVLFPRQRVSKSRLGIQKPRSVSDIGKRSTTAVEEALERHGKRADLATALSVADISMRPGEFVGIVGVIAVVAGLVGLLLGGPLVALVVAMVICFGVRSYVRRTKAKRQAAFADQLPDVLQLVTTALRSGYGLTQALDSVAEDAEEPARSEFAHVLVEARLGRDLSDSLRALAQRMESKDLGWVVAAIDINRETGGNLSEILNTVGATIRERQSMARHVRTLTAEGRLSARILTALPILMVIWQWRANPVNFNLLTYGAGLVALIIAGIFMVLGTVWVHRIVNSIST